MTLSIDTQNNIIEFHYDECRYAECRYAECCYAECRYAECRGAPKRCLTLVGYGLTRKH